MEDNIRLKLEMERAQGDAYKRAWESLVKPFFDSKKEELYEAFTQVKTSDRDGLVTVKLQHNALQSLEDEFQHYINTGNLASKQLEEEESNEQ